MEEKSFPVPAAVLEATGCVWDASLGRCDGPGSCARCSTHHRSGSLCLWMPSKDLQEKLSIITQEATQPWIAKTESKTSSSAF